MEKGEVLTEKYRLDARGLLYIASLGILWETQNLWR
jgi:hypothetical protein